MSDSKIKVALIGCGKMGMNHLRAVKHQENAVVAAVADPFLNEKKIRDICGPSVALFNNPASLFESVKPDVAHIATPAEQHASHAMLALNSGCHIYVEKPFAINSSDAEIILEAAEKAGLKVCAGHQLLFYGAALKARELLKQTGRTVHVESYFSFNQVRRNLSKTDQLVDILPHPVYLLLNYLFFPDEIPPGQCTVAINAGNGEIRAIIRAGQKSGILVVSLSGRPVESYVKIVGTSGTIHADFVRNTVIALPGGGAAAVSAILNPYRLSAQTVCRTSSSLLGMLANRRKSIPGLTSLIREFCSSVIHNRPSPISPRSIIATCRICEQVGEELRRWDLQSISNQVRSGPVKASRRTVLVTGGTGFLGKRVVRDLAERGFHVRVITRKTPDGSTYIPGAEYVVGDLSERIPEGALSNADIVVHCAAETAGGREEHARNTIEATRNIVNAATSAGIGKFVHISSTAILRRSNSARHLYDENTPLESGNAGRGSYVWAKSEAEKTVISMNDRIPGRFKVIRLGPLVDYGHFAPPGRLGRKFGNTFYAVGNPADRLTVCRIETASDVICRYVESFDDSPPVINVVEPEPPTRGHLVSLLRSSFPVLKVRWISTWIIKGASPLLLLAQKVLLPGRIPVDLYSAFASDRYKTDVLESYLSN